MTGASSPTYSAPWTVSAASSPRVVEAGLAGCVFIAKNLCRSRLAAADARHWRHDTQPAPFRTTWTV